MTRIVGQFHDIAGQATQGYLTVVSSKTRPSHGGGGIVTEERHIIGLTGGGFESPELDPGPIRVELNANGTHKVWELVLPESGTHEFDAVTESQHVYEPPVVGAAQEAAQEAREAAGRAVAAADGVDAVVAGAADSVRAVVAADADRAVDAREGAEAARDEASGMLAQKADLVGGVVPSSQIPAVAMTRPHVVADVAGLLALDVQEGDVGIIPDGPDRGSYMLGTGPATEIGSWKRLVTPESPVSSVNGQTGTITLGAGDVGAATAGDVAAVTGRVSALESSRPTLAEVQARPAMWLWDGSGQWAAPPGAVDTDTVLNTSTGEVHAIVEVTA
ncbi:hypothetical protein FOB82_02925 [Corynebacterium xerosis]|uniref:Minor tail protein n=1 Tax=Corynebacterium xerosis TaxID=1725 RepID=A0A6B8TKT8_9CORY|nr:hypothetical protein [Corynebacterium xerosis]QGS34052.1 hypothetical protein FOB82_02925 [Corynebacterium xerosis]